MGDSYGIFAFGTIMFGLVAWANARGPKDGLIALLTIIGGGVMALYTWIGWQAR